MSNNQASKFFLYLIPVVLIVFISLVAYIVLRNSLNTESHNANRIVKEIHVSARAFSLSSVVGGSQLNGVGIAGHTKNISFSTNNKWCELPYVNGTLQFNKLFCAPTKGYKITAVASDEKLLYVYDEYSHTIMYGDSKLTVPTEVVSISGMTMHKGQLILFDNTSKNLYRFAMYKSHITLLDTFNMVDGITGLASDGEYLYAAIKNGLLRFNDDFEITHKYTLDVTINGIAATQRGEIAAVSDSRAEIYIIVL